MTRMRVRDYHHVGRRRWIRLLEKGGKHYEVPARHALEAHLDAYLAAAELEEPSAPLCQSLTRSRRVLTGAGMTSRDAQRMLTRRGRQAGVDGALSPHSFRATGITVYLRNGGTLKHAQRIAAHASPRTTKLYNRTSDGIVLDEIERIRL